MKNFICTECGLEFEEPYEWQEKHGFHFLPYETRTGCPRCKGGYEKSYSCFKCSNHFLKEDLEIFEIRPKIIENGFKKYEKVYLCEKCMNEIYKNMNWSNFYRFLKSDQKLEKEFFINFLLNNTEETDIIEIMKREFLNIIKIENKCNLSNRIGLDSMKQFAKSTDGYYVEFILGDE